MNRLLMDSRESDESRRASCGDSRVASHRLVLPHAQREPEAHLSKHLILNERRNPVREAEEALRARHIEVAVVDGGHLDERRVAAADVELRGDCT